MKDIVIVLLLLIIITLFAYLMETNVGGAPVSASFPQELDLAQSSMGEPVFIYRMGASVHMIKIKAISHMQWIDSDHPLASKTKGIVRNQITFAGGKLDNEIDFDQFVEVIKRHKKEIKDGTLPSIIDLDNKWNKE